MTGYQLFQLLSHKLQLPAILLRIVPAYMQSITDFSEQEACISPDKRIRSYYQ